MPNNHMIKNLVVIEKDHPGLLATIATALSREGINITRLAALGSATQAIITLGVSDPHRALRILRENNFTVLEEQALVIALADTPGALAEITRRLKDSYINMKSAYIIGRAGKTIYLAISVDDYNGALAALKDFIYRP